MARATRRPPIFGATPLRRVIRKGQEFICGVCRKSHDTPAQANSCLRHCWAAHTSAPVDPVTSKSLSRWRCRACHREYALKEQAQNCAAECCSKLKMSFYSLSTNDPNALVATVTALPMRRKPMPSIPVPVRPTFKRNEAALPPASTTPQMVAPQAIATTKPVSAAAVTAAVAPAPIAAGPEVDASDTPAAAAPRKPKDRTKKFFRDGARYVCNECNAKFFTKSEVEACWEQHP